MAPDKTQINPLNGADPQKERPTLFVCILCGQDQEKPDAQTPGAQLYQAITAHAQVSGSNFPARVQKVKCLGGCNHPCAVALCAPGKTTYMYGDLPGAGDGASVVAALDTYVAQYVMSASGYVAPHDKPELFRDVLVRIPDLNFLSENGVVTPSNTQHVAQEKFPLPKGARGRRPAIINRHDPLGHAGAQAKLGKVRGYALNSIDPNPSPTSDAWRIFGTLSLWERAKAACAFLKWINRKGANDDEVLTASPLDDAPPCAARLRRADDDV